MFKPRDYAANYFFKAEKIIKTYKPNAIITMQFFQRQNNVILAGMNEVLKLLEDNTNTSKYRIKYLKEGSIINSKNVVLELEGKYEYFGVYEGMIDGILARATSIATNVKDCYDAAKGKEIIFMGDRSDHYINQTRDGIAAEVGGIKMHSTNAAARMKEELVFGSIPHVVIQAFDGDVTQVMKHYQKLFPQDKVLIALVDFNNNVIKDSINVLKAFGKNLSGVRVDTSMSNKDKMFFDHEHEYGVTPEQIKRLRKALNENGGQHVTISVSSGFNPQKITFFEENDTPVDAYGVGEYMLQFRHTFSCDAVKINGKSFAKEGRRYNHNELLIEYKSRK